jgi:hypothetical protein
LYGEESADKMYDDGGDEGEMRRTARCVASTFISTARYTEKSITE